MTVCARGIPAVTMDNLEGRRGSRASTGGLPATGAMSVQAAGDLGRCLHTREPGRGEILTVE